MTAETTETTTIQAAPEPLVGDAPSAEDMAAVDEALAVALGAEPREQPKTDEEPEPEAKPDEEPAAEEPETKQEQERYTIKRARNIKKSADAKMAEALALQQRLEAQQQEILRYQREIQQQRELVQRDPRAYIRQLPPEVRDRVYQEWTHDRLQGGSDTEQAQVSPEVAALRAEIEAARKWRAEQEQQQRQAQIAAMYHSDVGVVSTALREKPSDYAYLAAQPAEAQQAMIQQAVTLVHKHKLQKTAADVLRVLDQQCEVSYRHIQERLAPLGSEAPTDFQDAKASGTAGKTPPRRLPGRKAGSNSGLSNRQAAETRGAGREPTEKELLLEADDILRGEVFTSD